MRYMFLIYDQEKKTAEMPESAQHELFQGFAAFDAEVKKAGVLVGGEALQPTATATTVRVRDGKSLKTDGPFAETKEQLGGYYILECKDLDEALSWAAKIPVAKFGSIEIRPVMKFD